MVIIAYCIGHYGVLVITRLAEFEVERNKAKLRVELKDCLRQHGAPHQPDCAVSLQRADRPKDNVHNIVGQEEQAGVEHNDEHQDEQSHLVLLARHTGQASTVVAVVVACAFGAESAAITLLATVWARGPAQAHLHRMAVQFWRELLGAGTDRA